MTSSSNPNGKRPPLLGDSPDGIQSNDNNPNNRKMASLPPKKRPRLLVEEPIEIDTPQLNAEMVANSQSKEIQIPRGSAADGIVVQTDPVEEIQTDRTTQSVAVVQNRNTEQNDAERENFVEAAAEENLLQNRHKEISLYVSFLGLLRSAECKTAQNIRLQQEVERSILEILNSNQPQVNIETQTDPEVIESNLIPFVNEVELNTTDESREHLLDFSAVAKDLVESQKEILNNLNSAKVEIGQTVSHLAEFRKWIEEYHKANQPQYNSEIVSDPQSDQNESQIYPETQTEAVEVDNNLILMEPFEQLHVDSNVAQLNTNEPELNPTGDTPEKIPSGIDEMESDQPERNSKVSEKNAEKQLRSEENGKDKMLVGSGISSANSTSNGKTSTHKRPFPTSKSDQNEDLPTQQIRVKRRHLDSTPIQTVHDSGDGQQAILRTNTTPLQEIPKLLKTNKSAVKAKKQSDLGKVGNSPEVRISDNVAGHKRPSLKESISSLAERFAKGESPSQILSDVIELMSSQMENVKVLMRRLRLFDRYPSYQLHLLESPLRRSLMETLLRVMKHYCHDSVVIKRVCDFIIKIDIGQFEIDWSPDQIEILLEIVCDDVSLTARQSALGVIYDLIDASYYDLLLKTVCQKPFVEKIFQSIRYQLDKDDYDESMKFSWKCLKLLCYKSVVSQKRFVVAGGISLFRLCYEKFPHKTDLLLKMTTLMCLLSGNKSLCQELMTYGNLTLWQIWREDKERLVSYKCCQIFTNFLSDSTAKWPLGPSGPTKEEVEQKLAVSTSGKTFG